MKAHRLQRPRFALILAAIGVIGCGSKTDPGSGTGTLFALIEVTGESDATKIEVEVKARGNPVIGANVAFVDVERDQEVNAEAKSAGLYRATIKGYARTLAVKITSGGDNLEAQLEGPAPHVITRPPNNSRVRRRDFEVLRVEWESDSPAERTEVVPEDADKIVLESDPQEAEIPLGALKNGEQSITVIRESNVDLAGGTTGSRMRSRYTVDNRFTLEG